MSTSDQWREEVPWKMPGASVHADTRLEELEREGVYTPPSGLPVPWPEHPDGPRYTEAQFEAMRAEMKGEST